METDNYVFQDNILDDIESLDQISQNIHNAIQEIHDLSSDIENSWSGDGAKGAREYSSLISLYLLKLQGMCDKMKQAYQDYVDVMDTFEDSSRANSVLKEI